MTQSVWLLVYKNITESALFFVYTFLTRSALIFDNKNALSLYQFQKFHEKLGDAKCQAFCILSG